MTYVATSTANEIATHAGANIASSETFSTPSFTPTSFIITPTSFNIMIHVSILVNREYRTARAEACTLNLS